MRWGWKRSLSAWIPILAVLAGCSPATSPLRSETEPERSLAVPTIQGASAPALSAGPPLLASDLHRGCESRAQALPGPREGELAIDFTLRDVAGTAHTLSDLLAQKPVVLIFGSFT